MGIFINALLFISEQNKQKKKKTESKKKGKEKGKLAHPPLPLAQLEASRPSPRVPVVVFFKLLGGEPRARGDRGATPPACLAPPRPLLDATEMPGPSSPFPLNSRLPSHASSPEFCADRELHRSTPMSPRGQRRQDAGQACPSASTSTTASPCKRSVPNSDHSRR